ncbi:Acg family FMN-binding oxidoreductase [Thiohalomonas denitrificans]|uniref:Nitroreductase family protein n=1 Tax=Thiohalomonas denitrificans TaxID=415747 RepID=A0A1G5R1V1_9GAMM|nr:nitroreductase [Thiohalomonas denitrificans]SCZ67926.1 Nitroreductase family protein [Thiohalomonas denitrificans]
MEISKGRNERAFALIDQAVLAPSSHNTQPWLFRISESAIDLYADRSRALPVNDPEDRELTISCGCALMNLRVAAAVRGEVLRIELLPSSDAPDWLARASFCEQSRVFGWEAGLGDSLARRRTYRKRFAAKPVDSTTRDHLVSAAKAEGAWLRPLLSESVRGQAASLVAAGDAKQWGDPDWRRELAAWMRPRHGGDGLTLPALAAPVTRWVVRHRDMGRSVGAKNRALVEAAPLLAVLGTDGDGPRDWLLAGQALQHALLVATRHGLQASYFNQPIEVAELRPRLAQLLKGGGFPQILLRFGQPVDTEPAPPRRPVDAVVEFMESGR